MEQRFYKCERCGQIIAIVKNTDIPVFCCGEEMKELLPGTTDAAVEKHVPVYEIKDGKVLVTVGSVEHPATEEHHIEWIALVTNRGIHFKHLKETDHPCASFHLDSDEEVCCIYTFCNLHGLWKASEE